VAIAFVSQSTYTSGALGVTTQSNTFSSTTGNTLIALASGYITGNTTLSLVSVSDSTGTNNWNVVNGTYNYYSASTYTGCTALGYCVGATAISTATITWSAIPGINSYLQILQFSGVPTGACQDANATATYPGTGESSIATPSIIPTATTDILIGLAAANGSFTGASAGTLVMDGLAIYKIITAPGTSTSTTFTGSSNPTIELQTIAIGLPRQVSISAPNMEDAIGANITTIGQAITASTW
jgi:hypothetical protein